MAFRQMTDRLAGQESTIEWMRVRLNQVEAERAALLAQVTGARVMVPTIRPVGTPVVDERPGPIEPTPDGVLSGLSALFEDMGDDAADAAGIGHDTAGVIAFRK